jgi:hypothetical protein
MHLFGPLIDAAFVYSSKWFSASLSTGIVPIFFLQREQSMKITPYMGTAPFDHSQTTSGSPYFYADLSLILFKYVSLSLLYEYSKLDYDVIGFNANGWVPVEQKLVSNTLNFEVSFLLPLGYGINAQIGYGNMFNSVIMDVSSPAESNKQYFIIGVKKFGF